MLALSFQSSCPRSPPSSTSSPPTHTKKGEQLFEGQAAKPLEATDDPTSTVDEKRTCYVSRVLTAVCVVSQTTITITRACDLGALFSSFIFVPMQRQPHRKTDHPPPPPSPRPPVDPLAHEIRTTTAFVVEKTDDGLLWSAAKRQALLPLPAPCQLFPFLYSIRVIYPSSQLVQPTEKNANDMHKHPPNSYECRSCALVLN